MTESPTVVLYFIQRQWRFVCSGIGGCFPGHSGSSKLSIISHSEVCRCTRNVSGEIYLEYGSVSSACGVSFSLRKQLMVTRASTGISLSSHSSLHPFTWMNAIVIFSKTEPRSTSNLTNTFLREFFRDRLISKDSGPQDLQCSPSPISFPGATIREWSTGQVHTLDEFKTDI